jgi:hypothetical protein
LALQTDLSASKWLRDNFDKGCTLQQLISLPKDTADPVFRKRQAEIQDEMEDKRSRYMIVRAGEVTVDAVSMSSKEADALAHRQFNRDEIDRVFGYPEGYWSAKANRANSEAAKASLIEQAVWPLACDLAGDATVQIVRRNYEDDLRCEPEDFRPRDRVLALAEQKQHWTVKRIKEARAELGLEPLGDERDDLLVPELQKQSVPDSGEAAPENAAHAEQAFSEKALDFEACSADLRKWQSIALRRLKNGEPPGEYEFESMYIPSEVHDDILSNLKSARSEGEVKAAFAVPFRFPY